MLKTMPRGSPLKSFFCLSLLCVGALSTTLGLVVSRSLSRTMVERELTMTGTFVQTRVRERDLQWIFLATQTTLQEVDPTELVAPLQNIPEVVRIKVYDRRGTILWADEPRLIGQRFPDNHELREALGGKIEVEFKRMRKREHLYERDRYAVLAEIYVPIFDTGGRRVIGVVELYKYPFALLDQIRKARFLIWAICLAGGAVLHASVYWLFRRSYRLQCQLQEISRHKSEFLSRMSHELRTPLNAIIGFSQLLENQVFGPLNPKQLRYAGHIQKSGEHLLQIINDLLDFSKVEAGKLEVHPEPLPVAPALEQAVTLLGGVAEKKALTVQTHLPAHPLLVSADPLRLKQILYNLLSNAMKFTPEGGRITVSARRGAPSMAEIAVADTGIGLSPADRERIFEAFHQVDSALGRQQPGTGLGLPITKRLVELHGGTIEVSSSGAGQGCTFTVRLPLASPADAQVQALSPA